MGEKFDTTEVVFLSSSDTQGLATPNEFVDAVREGYRQRGDGAPASLRTTLTNDDPSGKLKSYHAILPETGVMGGCTYSAGFSQKRAWFFIPLFDASTGEPLALVDGLTMNPFKTGAVGAVGIDALARPDASSVGVFGSGRQARSQLLAASTVRDLDEVRVYSPTEEHRRGFVHDLEQSLDATVLAVDSPTRTVTNADIVITASNSTTPVFDGSELPEGVHVTAMGQYAPDRRELDTTTIARATYVPDLRERARFDAGAFLHAVEAGAVTENHIYAELGDIVAGTVAGRANADDITVFDSGGTGIETVAAANLLYERALDRGVGTSFELSHLV